MLVKLNKYSNIYKLPLDFSLFFWLLPFTDFVNLKQHGYHCALSKLIFIAELVVFSQ